MRQGTAERHQQSGPKRLPSMTMMMVGMAGTQLVPFGSLRNKSPQVLAPARPLIVKIGEDCREERQKMEQPIRPSSMPRRRTPGDRMAKDRPVPGWYCCICGQFAKVPFDRCNYCGDTPSYHHGRCCPHKPPPRGVQFDGHVRPDAVCSPTDFSMVQSGHRCLDILLGFGNVSGRHCASCMAGISQPAQCCSFCEAWCCDYFCKHTHQLVCPLNPVNVNTDEYLCIECLADSDAI